MKIYKVSFNGDPDGQKGFEFHSSRRNAEAAARKWMKQEQTPGFTPDIATHEGEIEVLEITPTKHGIISALNCHAGHPDNG